MMLEAVWFKNSKEVYNVCPVLNVLCEDDMKDISEIEVKDWDKWHEYSDIKGGADDFIIRLKKG